MIEDLYKVLKKNNSDAAFCDYNRVNNKMQTFNNGYAKIYNEKDIKNEIIPNILYNKNIKERNIQAVWAGYIRKKY